MSRHFTSVHLYSETRQTSGINDPDRDLGTQFVDMLFAREPIFGFDLMPLSVARLGLFRNSREHY